MKSKENNQFQAYAGLTLSISFRTRVAFGAQSFQGIGTRPFLKHTVIMETFN